MTLKLNLAALIGLAADLNASGAVRDEGATKFNALRTGLDQLAEQADDLEKAAAAPAPPGVAEFAELAGKVDQLQHAVEAAALVTDHTADQVAALAALANAKG